MKRQIGAFVLSGLLSFTGVQAAHACAFHGYTPSATLVDLLLDTEQVVIAKLAPSNAEKLVPVETLLGPTVSEITIAPSALVSSSLRQGSVDSVLLARDGAYGPWREITLLDDPVRTLVKQIIARQSTWQLGGNTDRAQMFARLVNDPNPNIRRLALQELDRAPYRVLKGADIPTVRDLAAEIDVQDSSLRPIRILLAGLSGDQAFVPHVETGLDQAVRYDVAYTGAYATALIELTGTDGVSLIRDRYLVDTSLPDVTRDRLIQALAIQYGSSDSNTRQFITQEVAALSRNVPGFREAAALQFGF